MYFKDKLGYPSRGSTMFLTQTIWWAGHFLWRSSWTGKSKENENNLAIKNVVWFALRWYKIILHPMNLQGSALVISSFSYPALGEVVIELYKRNEFRSHKSIHQEKSLAFWDNGELEGKPKLHQAWFIRLQSLHHKYMR